MSFFKKLTPKKAPPHEHIREAVEKNELEHLTKQLMKECGEEMDRCFAELTRHYSADNPIEEGKTAEILKRLVCVAVGHRSNLVGRVERGIEEGVLFNRYYGKLKEINATTSEAYTAMQRMDAAHEEWQKAKIMYEQVRRDSYTNFPNDDTATKTSRPVGDLWEKIWDRQDQRGAVVGGGGGRHEG